MSKTRLCPLLLATAALLVACSSQHAPRTASQGGAQWVALRTRHLVIETDLAADDARSVAEQYEAAYCELAAVVIPGAEGPPERTEVVLFRNEDEFHATLGRWQAGGFFFDQGPLDLERHPTVVMPHPRYGEGDRITLLHELTHRLVNHVYGTMPVWLNEGLAQYFSTLRIRDGEVWLGEPLLFRAYTADVLPTVPALLAMDRLHLEGRDLPDDYRRADQMVNNYIAAWALVHFFRNGPDAYRARFQHFVSAMNRGMRAKDAWGSSFGDIPIATLEAAYRGYLNADHWDVFKRTLSQKGPAPIESVEVIADADVHLLWLRALASSGSPAASQLAEASRDAPDSAEVAYWRGSVDYFADRLADARFEFEAVLRERPDDPRSLFGLAVTLGKLLRETPAGVRAELADSLSKTFERLARTARSADELLLVGSHFANGGDSAEAIARLDAAVAIAPGYWRVHAARAYVLAKAGRYDEAADAQEHAVAVATESEPSPSLDADLRRYRALAAGAAAAAPSPPQQPPLPPPPPSR
jgi:tetratricopeptide (TPR) repeat protein